jgi:Flp pilus assembly protein TadD
MTDEEHANDWPGVDAAVELIRAYERAGKLDLADAQMDFNYGLAFLELGSGLENYAIEAFKTALRLRPNWSAAHSQLGISYASANRRVEAIESYMQALTLQPDDTNTLAALAHASLFLGRYKDTERAATQMIEAAPLASVPHLILGVAQLLQCRYADADESLNRAVSLDADLAEACYEINQVSIIHVNDSVGQLQQEKLILRLFGNQFV